MVGQTISHYRVLEQLGEGGMGVVYKAEDTKLERTVALKFLAAHLLNDDEAKQRFLREAKAAAALDHPNICTVHEIDEADGKTFLAMAFLKGETLEDRIAKGPLSLKDALDFGRQVAEGLQAAHLESIVHRDIKPANILISPEGRATIMDFGLARLTEASRLTRKEQTLGTAAYMSPEQMQGAEVDHRADVWALGCVLYEMVAGARVFKGEYAQALAYEIVSEQPEPLTGLRTGVPIELELLADKCLAKDADQRYQSTADLIVDLGSLQEKLKSGRSTLLRSQVAALPSQAGGEPAHIAAPESVPKRRRRILQALLAVTTTLALALAFVHFSETAPKPPLRRFAFTPTDALDTTATGSGVAISPNGKHIAYATADRKLWIQDLDQSQPRALEGTEGAYLPFWSPDSAYIGFATPGELKKVSVEGRSLRICPLSASVFAGGAWSADGESIVFGSSGSIYEVPARGGTADLLIEPIDASSDAPTGILGRPHFLPPEAGKRVLIYTFGAGTERTMMVQDLESGKREVLGPGTHPFYSPSGHLIYQADLTVHDLWAMPFSLDTLQATGEAFPIARNGRGPTVASDQTLVYVDGSGSGRQQLVWRDRAGRKLGEIGQPQSNILFPALSPDDRSVAVRSSENGNFDIWVHEVERPIKRRLTFDEGLDSRPQWSPSGREIAFHSLRGGTRDIYQRAADGNGTAELLFGAEAEERAYGWSRDGQYFIYTVQQTANTDVWFLKRKGDESGYESAPFLETPFKEDTPTLSPDGRFLAYCSDASGSRELYVRPFPSGDGQWQVSTNGGCQPRWSRDGKELFYVEAGTLMAVEIATTPAFAPISTTPLFTDSSLTVASAVALGAYDVSADGRFVMTEPAGSVEGALPSIRLVENWYEEFHDR